MAEKKTTTATKPRTNKKAAAKIELVQNKTSNTTEQMQPVVNTTSTITETQPQEAKSEQKPKKAPVVNPAGTIISSGRVRRFVDELYLNKKNDEKTLALKNTIRDYTEAIKAIKNADPNTDPAIIAKHKKTIADNEVTAKDVESQLSALSRGRIRFSNDASRVMSIICDMIAKELASFAIGNVLQTKKNRVMPSHVYQPGLEALPLYALYRDLPTFVATQQQLSAKTHEERFNEALSTALADAEKSYKKKYEVKLTKEQREAERAAKLLKKEEAKATKAAQKKFKEEKEAKEEEQIGEDDDSTFFYYINNLFTSSKPTGNKTLRISQEIKSFSSHIIDEFLIKLSNQMLAAIEFQGNKTITDKVIFYCVKTMLIHGHAIDENLQIVDFVEKPTTDGNVKAAAEKKYKYDISHTRTYPTCHFDALKTNVCEVLEKLHQLDKINGVQPAVEAI